jgi:hypothetical protein
MRPPDIALLNPRACRTEATAFGRKALTPTRPVSGMRRARMMVMQIDGQLLPQMFVAAHGAFDKALLKIAWQIRPKRRQCGPSHVMFKS